MSSKKDQTRIRLLESALRLLTDRGYYGVGLEEVARDAGVSRQTVYLLFKSKAGLLIALAQYQDELAGTPEILQGVFEAPNALEKLNRGIAAYGTIEPLIYDAAALIYTARGSDQAAEAAWQERMEFRWGNIHRGIEALEREGLLAEGWTVDEATDFTWALLSLHTYEYLVRERKWPLTQFVRRLTDLLHATIVVTPRGNEHG
jgi:AcrR family transcriptional regulator